MCGGLRPVVPHPAAVAGHQRTDRLNPKPAPNKPSKLGNFAPVLLGKIHPVLTAGGITPISSSQLLAGIRQPELRRSLSAHHPQPIGPIGKWRLSPKLVKKRTPIEWNRSSCYFIRGNCSKSTISNLPVLLYSFFPSRFWAQRGDAL